MWSSIQNVLAIVPGHGAPIRAAVPANGAQPNVVMMLSFFAAFLTLVCYIERRRYRWVKFAMGALLLLNGGFAIAAGAWPLGTLQFVWAGCAFVRWWSAKRPTSRETRIKQASMPRHSIELYRSNALNN